MHNDRVEKLDTGRTGTRVVEQGVWLRMHECQVLPKVYEVHRCGYVMERLTPPEAQATTVQLLVHVANALNTIWYRYQSADDLNHFIRDRHSMWLRKLLRETLPTDRHGPLLNAVQYLPEPTTLQRRLTHGDPIVDNVMHRDDVMVLIDPIPSTYAVPDVLCSDVGRLIQSGLGYEGARYGFDTQRIAPRTVAELAYEVALVKLTDEEYAWALYWAALHCLRGVRTAPVKHDVLEVFEAAWRELQSWMR